MSDSLRLGTVLTLAGGLQDAYSYNCRGQVFANAQTGNIVLLGQSLAGGQWVVALHYVFPLLAFLAGVYASEWVRHLGRHSRTLPGLGLDDKWNLCEKNTTSTFRLKLDTQEGVNVRLSEDAAKALRDFGVSGGPYVPVAMRNGDILWGALRYAELDADTLGAFRPGTACIVRKKIGDGTLYYCGTNVGEGSFKNKAAFDALLGEVLRTGNAAPTLGARGGVRADALYERDRLNFIALRNPGAEARPVSLGFEGRARGLFSGLEIEGGREISVPAGLCDLFTVEPE